MSSPAPGASDGPTERRKSIGKYMKRLGTVLRRGSSSKASAPSTATTATPSTSTAVPAAPATTNTPAPVATTPTTAPAQASGPGTYTRSTLQQERARALFAKYGLTLESHEWITTGTNATNVQRVEKPIRMRVHRSCHRCGATYGADKICAKCEHKRCKKCPRYPKKKPKTGEKGKGPEESKPKPRKPLLTIKSKTGGELVYQPSRQRVRRTCHKCETMFQPPSATICEKCQHVRCTKCPRDPAKLEKWPEGYPGDAAADDESDIEAEPGKRRTWRRARQRVRWSCEKCQSLFKDGSQACSECGHERCDICTRIPPKKARREKEFDPELVKRVEEKLARFSVGETPTTLAAAA